MVKVVFDTNGVVSAALKPGRFPASLVALAMAKQVELFLSPRFAATRRPAPFRSVMARSSSAPLNLPTC